MQTPLTEKRWEGLHDVFCAEYYMFLWQRVAGSQFVFVELFLGQH